MSSNGGVDVKRTYSNGTKPKERSSTSRSRNGENGDNPRNRSQTTSASAKEIDKRRDGEFRDREIKDLRNSSREKDRERDSGDRERSRDPRDREKKPRDGERGRDRDREGRDRDRDGRDSKDRDRDGRDSRDRDREKDRDRGRSNGSGKKPDRDSPNLDGSSKSRAGGSAIGKDRERKQRTATSSPKVESIHKSTQRGNIENVVSLLKKGVDPNVRDEDHATALHYAAYKGHADIIKVLLEHGADALATDVTGCSPLHKAVFSDHPECLELLIAAEHDKDAQDEEGSTALHFASFKNAVTCGKILLEAKADPNIADVEGSTALHHACFRGYTNFVKLLLEHEAKIDATDVNRSTPLHNAAFNGNLECVKLLVEKGASLNSSEEPTSPLHHACYNGHAVVVGYLVNKGAQINYKDTDEGATPLHKAVYKGHLACLDILLEEGADFTIQDKEGSYPLHKAAYSGQVECLAALLKKGAGVDCKDYDDGTPLHNAAFAGNLECVEVLLNHKANVNEEDDRGQTPLHIAASSGHQEIARLLINSGAMIDTQNDQGKSPLHIAVEYPECVKALLDGNAEVDCKDFKGRTALCYAAMVGNTESLTVLIRAGASVDVTDKKGKKITEGKCKVPAELLAQLAEERIEQRNQKFADDIKIGVQKFNGKPKSGIDYLVEKKIIKEDFDDIAKFLLTTPECSKTKVGEFLSENDSYSPALLQAYMNQLDFTDIKLDTAMRTFLVKFRLPGEAQKIDRLIDAFAARFCACNPKVFQYVDTCYMLAFSLILLNTDQHNSALKKRMTLEEFLASNSRLDWRETIPAGVQEELYHRIKKDEIKMESVGIMFGSADKRGFLTKQGGRVKTWKKRWFILSNNCLYYFKKEEDKEPWGNVPLENLSVRRVISKGGKKWTFEIYDSKLVDEETGKKIKLSKDAKEEYLIKSCKKEKAGEGFSKGNHASYLLCAETEEEMNDWIEAIKRNIKGASYTQLLKEKAVNAKKATK
eukprot:TRINITY_DN11243_c0_g1_i1.p1 TRINITY_DN11243_c0_g1~~TRINITY_DN11243_c0_g1_i1.p1  ORF type:complete len:991 (-),score=275.21 TRINITY_DN11243_c0_g1_i1:161-3133(-)